MGDRPTPTRLRTISSFKGSGRLSVTGDIRGTTTGAGDDGGKVSMLAWTSLDTTLCATTNDTFSELYDTHHAVSLTLFIIRS